MMKAVPRALIQAMSLIRRVMWCCLVLRFFMMQTPFAALNVLRRNLDLRRHVSAMASQRRRREPSAGGVRAGAHAVTGGERPHLHVSSDGLEYSEALCTDTRDFCG